MTINNGVILQRSLLADSSKKDSSNLDKSAYKLVLPGDIAYNKMRAWQGAVGLSEFHGIVSPAYIVMTPRALAEPRYYHYLLRTPAFAKEAERWSYGITSDQWSLRSEHFKMIYCSVPPLPEQRSIVRFLDYMDRRIRRSIAAKKKLIALLNEQKQAIIHHAVTRGLDPGVRLKPSGVEWLGDVPAHWELRRIASFSTKITNGWVGPTRDILVSSGTPYIQSLHIKNGKVRFQKQYFVDEQWLNEHSKVRLATGDVVVVQTGDIGQVAAIPADFNGAGCHALIIIRTDERVVSGRFLDLILRSRYGYTMLKYMQTGALHP
ncbi:MAG: restriction endonuclease subunit S, partial [Thermoanaerobaculia bacterium]